MWASFLGGQALRCALAATWARHTWYASEPREDGGLALAYDVGDGRISAPAVHANVKAAKAFDVDGFFAHVGRPEATALYDNFANRLPRSWNIWYFGVRGAYLRL